MIARNLAMLHGLVLLRNGRTSKCLTLFSKLPTQMEEKWKGCETRGVCKVVWKFYDNIPLVRLTVGILKLSDGSMRILSKCPPGSELCRKSGLKMMEAIQTISKDASCPRRVNRESILFFHPTGYFAVLSGSSIDDQRQKLLDELQEKPLSLEITLKPQEPYPIHIWSIENIIRPS